MTGNYYQKLSVVYQKPEIRVPVEIILSVFASVFLIMAAVRPTLVTVTELKKKIADQELVERKLETKINKLVQARNQLDKFADDLVLFERAVPENYTYANLAKKVEIIAYEQDVSIESLSFSPTTIVSDTKEPVNTVEEFLINFDVVGNEVQLVNFLKEVENLDRVSLISSVELAKVKEREVAEGKIRASGKIKSYYLVKDEKKI